MPLRNATALTFRPKGVTDAVDATDAAAGSLSAGADLIPSMHTRNVWVPRPAAYQLSATPVTGELLKTIGSKVYGFTPSSRFIGHSEPFALDEATQLPIPIAGITEANTPITAPVMGDWTPPTFAAVGAYLLFTHPGFHLPNAFGWLDQTGFTDTATGTTGFGHVSGFWGFMGWGSGIWGSPSAGGGNVIANLSKNVLLAGWRPGLLITDSSGVIPVDTRIDAISADGLSILLTKSAVGSVVGDTLTVFGGTPAFPLWSAGNTNQNPLPAVPTAVSQFNGRAFFAVGSATPYSDALDPLQRTNANQVLTYDNGLDVTAFGTIPFQTTAGGIIQSLLAFQGDAAIQQITGDQATGNLAKNLLSEIGTLAPNAIVSTPEGVVFIAPDGLRVVNQTGVVSPPIGANGDGVALPFVNAIFPSRMCAAYNEDVVRISATYNDSLGGSVISQEVSAEFWYHIKLKAWSCPHSFPAALIASLDGPRTRHGHITFPLDPNAKGLWFSNTRPMIDSAYTENGRSLRWLFKTSLLPDNEQMFMNGMNETTVMISLPVGVAADVAFVNETGTLLDSVKIAGFNPQSGFWGAMLWGSGRWGGNAVPAGLWGTMIWGQSVWGAGVGGATLAQRLIPWDRELVFKQGQFLISGPSSPQIAIGNLYMRYQITGYTLEDPGPFVGQPVEFPFPPILFPQPPVVGPQGPSGPPGPTGPVGPPGPAGAGGIGTVVELGLGQAYQLPAATSTGQVFTVIASALASASTPNIVSAQSGVTINGSPTFSLHYGNAAISVWWNGTQWRIF